MATPLGSDDGNHPEQCQDRPAHDDTPVPPPEVEGRSEGDATEVLTDAGFIVRVVERDGEQFPMTMDYRDNRVNLAITNGVVTSATVG